MTEAEFDAARTGLREHFARTVPAAMPDRAGCLTLQRARAAALDPGSSAAEQAHLARCPRCRSLVMSFARHTPHLSTWALLWDHLGTADRAERQRLAFHLRGAGCETCRMRSERVRAQVSTVLRLSGPIRLPDLTSARAASEGFHLISRSEDGRLEAEILEEDSVLSLEIRTRDPRLEGRLVHYVLRAGTPGGAAGEGVEGFVPLRPDVQGWWVGTEVFDAGRLAPVRGGGDDLWLTLADLETLSAPERERLRESAARARDGGTDSPAAAAWASWLLVQEQSAAGADPEVREFLNQVRAGLRR